ncbi:hypothetical protein HK096_007504 [Nowakowskiella sp. JEL0078]|nr:hypothetical protein HK096_007504 [Nowakowskiella sp. JEL0078]
MNKIIVSDELNKNEAEVTRLKLAVSTISSNSALENLVDDVFILRFILAFGPGVKAETNLREAIIWRIENAALLKGIREGTSPPPFNDLVSPYIVAGLHKELTNGSPVFILRTGVSDVSGLFKVATADQLTEWFLFLAEKTFALCDKKTKETGILIQSLRISDFTGSTLFNADTRFFSSQGVLATRAGKLYPHLLGLGVIINHPTAIDTIVDLVTKFVPSETFEKFKFCKGKSTDDVSKCPFASKFIAKEDLPTFLGGTCVCPSGCLPNNQ